MTMTIAPFDATARARIAQLINKSNQFNLTTRRYTEDEVADLERANDAIHWQVRLADRFGDHGMIAVVIVRAAGAVWSVDSWLMSCRVLERGVEQALMNALVARAADAGIEGIEGRYVPTPRNGLVRDFFDRMRFARTGEGADGTVRYRLDVAGYQPFETFIALKVA
jgi:FkbH-like protein